MRRAMPVTIVAALLALAPTAVRSKVAKPPRVDLTRIEVGAEGATAPFGRGKTAKLTLDPKLQRTARRLLAQASPVTGAVVAVEVRTGKVLAWAERRRDGKKKSVLLAAGPPAASVFKIVTTAALLKRGQVPPSRKVCYRGGSHGIERRHLDPPRTGRVVCSSFAHALGHSRNAVYAQLATHHLSRSDLIDVAERIGFNEIAPFDVRALVGEVKVPYNDLEFARTAAGFTGSTLSPVGGAHIAYTIASGGVASPMHLVERAGDYRAPAKRRRLDRALRASTARRLTRMMEVTVKNGTSADVFTDKSGRWYLGTLNAAGKTGTLTRGKQGLTTTWFVGFAPSRRPQIVVSVLIQNGKVWRRKANEVARDVLRAYFANRRFRGIEHPLAAAR